MCGQRRFKSACAFSDGANYSIQNDLTKNRDSDEILLVHRMILINAFGIYPKTDFRWTQPVLSLLRICDSEFHYKPRLGRFYKAVFLTAHTASVLLCLLGNRQLTSLRSAVLLWVVKDLSKRRHADSESSYQSVCMHRLVFQ